MLSEIGDYILFIGVIISLFCFGCDTSDYAKDFGPASTIELSIVDSIEIKTGGILTFADYFESDDNLLFQKWNTTELYLLNRNSKEQKKIEFNKDNEPGYGKVISSCGFDIDGNIIVITETGGFRLKKPYNSYIKIFDHKVQYPNSINTEIVQVDDGDENYWLYMNKSWFEENEYLLPNDPEYFNKVKLFNIFSEFNSEIVTDIGFDPKSIFRQGDNAPNKFPGASFHFVKLCNSFAYVINPDLNLFLSKKEDGDWINFHRINLEGLLYEWEIHDTNQALRYGSPKFQIVSNSIRRLIQHGESIIITHVSSVSGDEYDRLYEVSGDFNEVNETLNLRRSKYLTLIDLKESCSGIEGKSFCKLPKRLGNAQCVLGDNSILFSVDPLVYEKPNSNIFYLYNYNLL